VVSVKGVVESGDQRALKLQKSKSWYNDKRSTRLDDVFSQLQYRDVLRNEDRPGGEVAACSRHQFGIMNRLLWETFANRPAAFLLPDSAELPSQFVKMRAYDARFHERRTGHSKHGNCAILCTE
jgi:hypothetical protein